MRVAMGMLSVTEEELRFAAQIGVTDLVTRPTFMPNESSYSYESLVRLRSRVEGAGLRVAAIHDVPPTWNDKIRLGLSGRERQIDAYCRTIENMGRAGIPILGYSFHAHKVWRTSRHARGRGGALCTGYDHALMTNAPLFTERRIGDEERWEHLSFFLRRVIPAAESAGVRMALHPDDPPISPIAGAAYILRDMPAFQRVLELVPSPANGILFCQRCFNEKQGERVYDANRHVGTPSKEIYEN